MSEQKPTGRPTDYKPEYDDLAFKYCLLGATDKQLAEFFDIAESTLNNWKHAHPTFMESLKKGKKQADAEIAHSLYHNAKGYSHDAVQINVTKKGEVIETPFIKHYPPDTASAIFWLKNRQPEVWRDKIVHELPPPSGLGAIGTESLEVARTLAFLLRQGAKAMAEKNLPPIDVSPA